MNYFKNVLLLVAFMACVFFTNAQGRELVRNGSFENAEVKDLKKPGSFELTEDWTNGTYAPADLFSESAKGEKVSIPKNDYGYQETIDGENYAGFRAYTKDSKKTRTYLSTQLRDQLEEDKNYCISVSVSLADLSKYAVNNIGVLVTKNKSQKGDVKSIIDPNFQIKVKLNKVINEREGWVTICGTYTAKGGEGAVVIGCFDKNDNLKIEKMKKPSGMLGTQSLDAYYFVENVSVKQVEARSQCNCADEQIKEEVIYSPSYVNFDELSDSEKVAQSTVYFGQESAKISPVAKRDLKRFLDFLLANPELKLKVAGHMDLNEFDESRVKARLANLGEQRAQAVVDYLIANGVSEDRFVIKDKAASSPLSKMKTPMSLAKNRRVEFIML